MATIKDVAARVGVSVATVSDSRNGKPNVGIAVRRKAPRAATALVHRPHRAAQAVRAGRTRTIGLALPDLTNSSFTQRAQMLENKARTLGLPVCRIDSQGSAAGEAEGLTLPAQYGVGGVICCPLGPRIPLPTHTPGRSRSSTARGRGLRSFNRPISRAGNCSPDMHRDKIACGWACHRGRAAWRAPSSSATDSVPLIWSGSRAPGKYRRRSTASCRPRRAPLCWTAGATLVVAGNDLIAVNAQRFLTQHGVRVPENVPIVGFDDISLARLVSPRLTSIAQPLVAIGIRVVALLEERLFRAAIASQATVFDVTLVEREPAKSI